MKYQYGVPAVAVGTETGECLARSQPAVDAAQQVRARLSRDLYWESDVDGRIVRVDRGAVPGPMALRIGQCLWDDGALPLDGPDWQSHRARLERHEAFSEFAWVWTDPTGRPWIAIDSGEPRHDLDGRFIGYAGLSREASADVIGERCRRLATAALLAAREPVAWIEALTTASGGWRVIWANAAACHLFDRTERELLDLPDRMVFSSGSGDANRVIESALRGRHAVRMQADIARKHGDARTVDLRLEPLAGSTSLRACAALLLNDRSEALQQTRAADDRLAELRVQMEARANQLEASSRELESFTYTVSHDLRAPIRVIEGFARILEEDYGDQLDRPGHEHLQRIRSAATRMTGMVDALLELSRLSGQSLSREPIDLSRLADVIADELHLIEPRRQCVITVQPRMIAQADPLLVRVLLQNLIGNAWKYSSRRTDAHIEFRCTGQGADRVYCIEDNGAGFDMRYADRLFGVFQRLHSESEFPGTGVGLATVARIIRRHQGRIWAESAIDQGSRFYFTLGADTPTA